MSETEEHEPDVVAGRPIAKIGIGSAIVFLLGLGAAFLLLPRVVVVQPRPAPAVIGSLEQQPILDGDRGRRMQAAGRADLEHWHWIDRDAGVAAMPIDLAIDRLLDGGAP